MDTTIIEAEMETINMDELQRLIQEVVINLDEPIMVVGEAGCGKSVATAEAIEKAGAIQCDIRLGQYDSVDLRGFPGVDRETSHTVWHAPSTMPFIGNDLFPDDRIIVLTLDEATSGATPVMGIAYQLVNERRVGEHILKPNVRIMAMGNREIDRGIVNRMPFPLCNRMTWYESIVDVDVWCAWAQRVGIHPIFIAFIQWKKDLLSTFKPKESRKVVATPRTWAKAAKYYSSVMDDGLKRKSIAGAVGKGPATEFFGFLDIWQNIIPIKRIVADPMGTPVPPEMSVRYATAINISGSFTPKNMDPLYAYLCRMPAEFVIMAFQLAIRRDRVLMNSRTFIEFSKRYNAAFQ